MANVGAGVFQGMPVSTSLSASSLNESAGARTPVASLVTGGLVLATLVVLAPLFSELPKAVLAAIIIDAVVFGMIDIPELRRLYRVTRFDFWIAVAAILGGALGRRPRRRRDRRRALARLARSTSPRSPRCRFSAASPAPRCSATSRRTRTTRRSRASSCCGSTAACSSPPPRRSRTASALSSTTSARALVLDLEGVNFVDSQGSAKLTEIHEFLDADGVELPPRTRQASRSRGAPRPTGSSTGSAPTTSTATSTAPSRRSSANPPAGDGNQFDTR